MKNYDHIGDYIAKLTSSQIREREAMYDYYDMVSGITPQGLIGGRLDGDPLTIRDPDSGVMHFMVGVDIIEGASKTSS